MVVMAVQRMIIAVITALALCSCISQETVAVAVEFEHQPVTEELRNNLFSLGKKKRTRSYQD